MARTGKWTNARRREWGKALLWRRAELLRLTPEELAERTGLSATYLVRLERGLQEPRAGVLEALARGLGCPIERLFEPRPRLELLERIAALRSNLEPLEAVPAKEGGEQ